MDDLDALDDRLASIKAKAGAGYVMALAVQCDTTILRGDRVLVRDGHAYFSRNRGPGPYFSIPVRSSGPAAGTVVSAVGRENELGSYQMVTLRLAFI